MTRDRAYRRAQRDRHIAKRINQINDLYPSLIEHTVSGQLDNHSMIMCPDGRKCMVCHPHKGGGAYREPTRQEQTNNIEPDEEPLLEASLGSRCPYCEAGFIREVANQTDIAYCQNCSLVVRLAD